MVSHGSPRAVNDTACAGWLNAPTPVPVPNERPADLWRSCEDRVRRFVSPLELRMILDHGALGKSTAPDGSHSRRSRHPPAVAGRGARPWRGIFGLPPRIVRVDTRHMPKRLAVEVVSPAAVWIRISSVEHGSERGRISHFNATRYPTAQCVVHQLREAFARAASMDSYVGEFSLLGNTPGCAGPELATNRPPPRTPKTSTRSFSAS